jgi:hypothetical protein
MKRHNLFALLGLSLLATSCATEPSNSDTAVANQAISGPTDRLAAPLATLARASRIPLGFVVRQGVPVAISGSFEVGGATPLARARTFLAQYPTLYSNATLDLPLRHAGTRTINSTTLDHVVLYQRIGGVDVYGGELAFTLSGSTLLGAGGWVLPEVPKIDLAPAIGADDAERATRTLGGNGVLAATPKLFVYDRRAFNSVQDPRLAPVVLVWQVAVGGEQFLIDARDTSLVSRDTHVEELSTQIYDDISGDTLFDDGCVVASCSSTVQTLASSFATTHFFYKNRFGWEGYDGDDNENEVYTNTSDPTAYNVNWIGDEFFKFKNSQVALDITGHEYTHGVIDHKNGLDQGGEPGALNESFADLMGNIVEGNLPSTVGENSTGGSIRNMCSSATMASFIPNGEVHQNSKIPSFGWCKTSQLLTAAGNSSSTTRGKLADLAFALFDAMPSDSSFATMASLAMTEAHILFGGIGSNPLGHACIVHDAFKAVGISVSGPIDLFCSGNGADDDGDGVGNSTDNCRNTVNPSQLDTDGDGLGDLCDTDRDNDGVLDATDNCQLVVNADQKDSDHDGIGDACQDWDGDGVTNSLDNCVGDYNPGQADTDGDGLGNACETSTNDGDGVDDNNDNCQFVNNANQADADGDGLGDACDPCPTTYALPSAWTSGNPGLGIKPHPIFPDADGDGTPDACDGTPNGSNIKMNGGMASDSMIQPGTKVTVEGTSSASQPLLIPMTPCPRGGCVMFDDLLPLEIAITGADRMRVSVIDDRGQVVAKLTRGRVRFAPRGGRTYRIAVATTETLPVALSLVVLTTGGER